MKSTVGAAACLLLLVLAPASAQNLVVNPGFDHDLSGWAATNIPGLHTTSWSPLDAAGSPSSGSLLADNVSSTATNPQVVATQCIDTVPGQKYWLRAKVFIPSGQGATGRALISAVPGSGTCASPAFPFGVGGGFGVTAVGTLTDTGVTVTAPPGFGRMVLQLIDLKDPAGGSLRIYYDDFVFAPTSTAPCTASPSTLCTDRVPGDYRFETRVHYSSPSRGLDGDGHAVSLDLVGMNQGGAFWFFAAGNPEMLIKVLDGCTLNDHYWIFMAATTDVGFTVTVRDSVTGGIVSHANPDRTAAIPVQATSALPCE
ncbi:MAG: hypothetical protein ACM3OB_03385 [Acidobacteriota bacterium]